MPEVAGIHGTAKMDVSDIQRALGTFKSSIEQMKSEMAGLNGSNATLSVSLGNLVSGGIQNLIGGIRDFVSGGVDAVAFNERLGMSYEALMARELRNQSAVEKKVFAGYRHIAASEEQIVVNGKTKKSVDELTTAQQQADLTYRKSVQTLEELQGKAAGTIRKKGTKKNPMGDAYDVNPLDLEQAALNVKKYGAALEKANGQTKIIPAHGASTVATYKTVTEYTLTMAEAHEQARKKAEQLMRWTERLAIDSPFDKKSVSEGFKMAMAYGMNSDMAKKATQDVVDFSAAMGGTGDTVQGLLYAMGQINNSDKLFTQDLRQLMNRGVDVNKILKEMGTNLSAVGKSHVDPKKFLALLMKGMEEDFGGAAKAQANTITGMITSLEDLGEIAKVDFFTPMLTKAKPALDAIVTALQDEGVKGALQSLGGVMGDFIAGPLNLLATGVTTVKDAISLFMEKSKESGPVTALRDVLKSLLPASFGPTLDKVWSSLLAIRYALMFSREPARALHSALQGVVGLDMANAAQPLIDWIFGLPKVVSDTIAKVKAGDIEGAFLGLWGTLGTGAINFANLILKIANGIADEAKKGQWLTKIGEAFGTWTVKALDWLSVQEDKWHDPLVTLSSSLGSMVGKNINLVVTAFKTWIQEIAGFPAKAEDKDIQSGLATFATSFGRVVAKSGGLILDMASGFASQLVGGIFDMKPEDIAAMSAQATAFYRTIFGAARPQDAKPLADMQTDAQSWLKDTSTSIDSGIAAVGKEIGVQFWGGVENSFSGIKADIEPATTLIDSYIVELQQYLGIHSPSTMTQDMIGKPMGNGITEGAVSGMDGLSGRIKTKISAEIALYKQDPVDLSTLFALPTLSPTASTTATPMAVPVHPVPKISTAGAVGANGPAQPVTISVADIAASWGMTADGAGVIWDPVTHTVNVPLSFVPIALLPANAGAGGDKTGGAGGNPMQTAIDGIAASAINSFTMALSDPKRQAQVQFAYIVSFLDPLYAARDEMNLQKAPYVGSAPHTLGADMVSAVVAGIGTKMPDLDKAIDHIDGKLGGVSADVVSMKTFINSVAVDLNTNVAPKYQLFVLQTLDPMTAALQRMRDMVVSLKDNFGLLNTAVSNFTPPSGMGGGTGTGGGVGSGAGAGSGPNGRTYMPPPNTNDTNLKDNSARRTLNTSKAEKTATIKLDLGKELKPVVLTWVGDSIEEDARRYG